MIRTAKQLTRFKPGTRVKVVSDLYVGPHPCLRGGTESWIYRGYQDHCVVLEGRTADRHFIAYSANGVDRVFEVLKK